VDRRKISIFYKDAAIVYNLKKERFLCVADLHIGYSPTPSFPYHSKRLTMDLAKRIIQISTNSKSNNLILLGDIKHTIARITRSDDLEIRSFFEEIKPFFKKIYLVLGNHDGSIKTILPSYVITIRKGLLLGDVYFMHGHTLPEKEVKKANLIIMGHLHPIFFRPRSPLNGQRVWLIISLYLNNLFPVRKSYNIIITPSFNSEIIFPLNFSYSSEFSSRIAPLLNRCKFDIFSVKIISLDGVLLEQV
jgi:putative SbcD/Mre11-related phosphoesterase